MLFFGGLAILLVIGLLITLPALGVAHATKITSAEKKLSDLRQNSANIDKEKYERINSEDGECIIILSKDNTELEISYKEGGQYKRYKLNPGDIIKTYTEEERAPNYYKSYRLNVLTYSEEIPLFYVEFINFREYKKSKKMQGIKSNCMKLEARILAFNRYAKKDKQH